jgi:hypothetical protein
MTKIEELTAKVQMARGDLKLAVRLRDHRLISLRDRELSTLVKELKQAKGERRE